MFDLTPSRRGSLRSMLGKGPVLGLLLTACAGSPSESEQTAPAVSSSTSSQTNEVPLTTGITATSSAPGAPAPVPGGTTSGATAVAPSASTTGPAVSPITSEVGSSTSASVDGPTNPPGSSAPSDPTETSEPAASSGGTSSAPAEVLDPGAFAGDLDGHLYLGACNGGSASFECPLNGCTNGEFRLTKAFTLEGSPESTYEVALHVYGVVELRSDYKGGSRRKGTTANAQSEKDFWYEGGSYTPGAGYNVYGIRVTPAVEGVGGATDGGNNYFLNARDTSGEGHEVWELNYAASFVARGGSTVEFTAYDPNCLQIMNNRETAKPSAGSGPDGALMVSDVDSAEPPPSDFVQPLATNGRSGQWLYVDVTGVTLAD